MLFRSIPALKLSRCAKGVVKAMLGTVCGVESVALVTLPFSIEALGGRDLACESLSIG